MIWVRKDLFEQVIVSMVYNIRKISKVGSTKALPYILRRMKAAIPNISKRRSPANVAYTQNNIITTKKS